MNATTPLEERPTTEASAVAVKAVAVVVSTPANTPGFFARNATVCWFVVFLLLADFAVGLLAPVWERASPDDYTARVRGCAAERRDVVFVGGSPVAEGIDPATLAGTVWRGQPLQNGYAIGLSGGTTTDFYYATRLACPQPPRVLVYGMTASDLNDSRNEPHGTQSILTRADVSEITRTRPDASSWVIRRYTHGQINKASSLYYYRHGIRMWAVAQAERVFPGSCPQSFAEASELREHAQDLARGTGYAPLKGYARVRYDLTKAAGQPTNPFNYLDKFRTGSHFKYLVKLHEWCRERDVELVLVDMPVTADLEAKYLAEFAEYRDRLAAFERESRVTVIRAHRDATGLTDAHFADYIHLRQEGCQHFCRWLRAQLEARGAETRP